MKKFARIALITLLTLFILFVGLRIDVEYCIYTAASTLRFKVFGITLHTHHDDGYRSWLRDDIGVDLGSSYVPYLSGHPLLVGASTPPGNWLFLSTLKKVYDADTNAHAEVVKLLKDVATRNPPRLSADDAPALNDLVHRYLQKHNPPATTQAEQNGCRQGLVWHLSCHRHFPLAAA